MSKSTFDFEVGCAFLLADEINIAFPILLVNRQSDIFIFIPIFLEFLNFNRQKKTLHIAGRDRSNLVITGYPSVTLVVIIRFRCYR